MIKAVIFDMGGVVCNQMGADEAYDYLAKKLKVKKKDLIDAITDLEEDYQRNNIKLGDLLKTLFTRLGKTFKPEFKNFYTEGYEEGSPINIEIIDLIRRLREKKYVIGMITNTIDEHYNVHKKRGDYEYFDFVAASNKLKMRKPGKDIYLYTLRKLEISADEAIFIDNKATNLIPAEELGMKVILAKSPEQVVTDLEKVLKMK